jgi:hypothetical protein
MIDLKKKSQEYPIIVAFRIERYEDGKPGKEECERVRNAVLEYAKEIVANAPEDSLVTHADYFDLCGSMVYDRYSDDEDRHSENYGEEDRWCVDMHFVARFRIKGPDCIQARAKFWEWLNDLIADSIDDSIENYATNFNGNELNFIR